MNVQKGQKVEINGNSIFQMMGHEKVTGTVFVVRADGSGFSIRCDQTRCIETVDANDGEIKVVA
jgi:hypothetical protein